METIMATLAKAPQRKAASGKSSDTTQQLTWTGSYFVWSSLSGSSGNVSYGLNAEGGTPTAGTSIILWPWGGGQPNELWQYSGNQFVSNLSDSLVIGLGDSVPGDSGNYYLVLVQQDLEDLTQIWNVDESTGLITNAQYPDLYINASGVPPGVYITTNSLQAGSPDEIWALVPAWAAPPAGTPSTPVPTWCFIQSGLSPYENDQVTPYVLTIQGTAPVEGNNVILEALSSNSAPLQMWQLTSGPRVLALQGPANALTLGPNCSDNVWEVTVNSQQNPVTNMQHWDLGAEAPN